MRRSVTRAVGNVGEQHAHEARRRDGGHADLRERTAAFAREQILRPLGC